MMDNPDDACVDYSAEYTFSLDDWVPPRGKEAHELVKRCTAKSAAHNAAVVWKIFIKHMGCANADCTADCTAECKELDK